ncbi:MAG: hypothetical protein KVP17_002100 [Porospora cf. gigantea B]|uniref:uncharacterized protein n=1 Tax=Porospora cf. gigantea B TaxID=2853592 RepID=UPI003571C87C|nr:MAG: hypothetical protein KVP17_002100 [Porospora cf. gigantea B]
MLPQHSQHSSRSEGAKQRLRERQVRHDESQLVGRSRGERALDEKCDEWAAVKPPSAVRVAPACLPQPEAKRKKTGQPKQRSVIEALAIMRTALKTPTKYVKVLCSLERLTTAATLRSNGAEVLEFLRYVCTCTLATEHADGRPALARIIGTLTEHCADQPQPWLTREQSNEVQVLSIVVNVGKLFTDDSYAFNKAIDDLSGVLEDIVGEAREDQLEELEDEPEERAAEHRADLRRLRQQLYVAGLQVALSFKSVRWARPGVSALMKESYLKREAFDQPQRSAVEQAQTLMRESTAGSRVGQVTEAGRSQAPVIDGRQERLTFVHGSEVWSAKQAGL